LYVRHRSEWPIMIIDIEGYTKPIFSKTKLAEGETLLIYSSISILGSFYVALYAHRALFKWLKVHVASYTSTIL
jgi:hypothetical protein